MTLQGFLRPRRSFASAAVTRPFSSGGTHSQQPRRLLVETLTRNQKTLNPLTTETRWKDEAFLVYVLHSFFFYGKECPWLRFCALILRVCPAPTLLSDVATLECFVVRHILVEETLGVPGNVGSGGSSIPRQKMCISRGNFPSSWMIQHLE